MDDAERETAGRGLAAAGHPCSPVTAWRTLRSAGYTLQSNSKAAEGRQHPERDAQFRYIAAQASEHAATGQPVISVDARKREKIGNYGQDGRERAPQGSPQVVRSHDFADPGGRHAVPCGVYDEAADAGFVNVGTDGNTAALAVESVRRWWQLAGKDAYPGATRLLVTCDAGGSDGYRNRAWKAGLGGPLPKPAWRSPSATSRPARPGGTRSSAGCSARSPSAGAAAP